MKKILSLAVLLMTALVGFTACSDDENDDPKLALVQTTWDFGDLDFEIEFEDGTWIQDLTRHFSFYDDHTGMLIMEGTNTYLPNWDFTFTRLDQFTYTFDGTSGTIVLGKSTLISTDPVFNNTLDEDEDPIRYDFTINPDGKTMTMRINGGEPFEIPKMQKFDKKEWVEFPPDNSFDSDHGSNPFDPRKYGPYDPNYGIYI